MALKARLRITWPIRTFSQLTRSGVGEGTIAAAFGALQQSYPDVRMGSYPRMGRASASTELVLRAHDPERLAAAAADVRAMVAAAHSAAGLPPPPQDPY